jgi:hypothetical protein
MEKLDLTKFKKYNDYEKPVTAISSNWSSIQDKLIRLAAKYTDNYASDIIIDIGMIQKFIDEKYKLLEDINAERFRQPVVKEIFNTFYLFGFRESGVDHNSYIENRTPQELKSTYRSIWKMDFIKGEYENGVPVMQLYQVYYSNN